MVVLYMSSGYHSISHPNEEQLVQGTMQNLSLTNEPQGSLQHLPVEKYSTPVSQYSSHCPLDYQDTFNNQDVLPNHNVMAAENSLNQGDLKPVCNQSTSLEQNSAL